jgi:succinate dehydrogenase / fumarate reductase cytochrome b subunit
MSRPFQLMPSSLGSKVVVALTGLALAGFVVFHMLGNLQVFESAEALNAYATFLREMPMLLWTARLTLLGLAVVHVGMAIKLAVHNRRARPVPYQVRNFRKASLGSRTMAVTGSLLFLFIVFHLLHLSAGVVDSTYVDKLDLRGQRDVFGKVVHAFQNVWFVMIYLAAQAVLGWHLSHALSSSLQTLGIEHPILDRLFKGTGSVIALLVVIGNSAIILAVAVGIIRT